MNSRAVFRIETVRLLRANQFPEDCGPLAHPVRPDSYIKMDNFYSSTVYNKVTTLHLLCLFSHILHVTRFATLDLIYIPSQYKCGYYNPEKFNCRMVRSSYTYTPSKNEQGAEVIRMYEAVLGKAGFRKGMDLYFQRHDGQVIHFHPHMTFHTLFYSPINIFFFSIQQLQ